LTTMPGTAPSLSGVSRVEPASASPCSVPLSQPPVVAGPPPHVAPMFSSPCAAPTPPSPPSPRAASKPSSPAPTG
jgi:hypothetical protein